MINELWAWLEEHKENRLMIHKEELVVGKEEIADLDEVELHLENINIKTNHHTDPDHYVADQEIILYGQGKIKTDHGQKELPQHGYEIPLYGEIRTEKLKNGFKIQTEKARYLLQMKGE